MTPLTKKIQQLFSQQLQGKLLLLRSNGDCHYDLLAQQLHKIPEKTLEELYKIHPDWMICLSDDCAEKKFHSADFGLKNATVLAHQCSLEGLQNLQQFFSSKTPTTGKDLILCRRIPFQEIIDNSSLEAQALEFCYAASGEDSPLIFTRVPRGFQCDDTLELQPLELQQARLLNPALIEDCGSTETPLLQGDFHLHSFFSAVDKRYHWAFVCSKKDSQEKVPLVRVESECLTGHVFGSQLCDCGEQLRRGLEEINQHGNGALIYLRQEGRGIGLEAKLQAYYMQQVHGMDTVDANLAVGMPEEARDYLIGAQILHLLNFYKIRLLTNNPAKISGLAKYGIDVEQQVPHIIEPGEFNKRYLDTKKSRMGHMM